VNTKSLLNHLEAYVADEIAGKRKALEWIEAQEKAIASNDAAGFEAATTGLKSLTAADGRSEIRRRKLTDSLAEAWRVSADALTLGSIAKRAGTDGRRLGELRTELRALVAKVMKRSRRLGALIGMHSRLNREIMETAFGSTEENKFEDSGSLVNAEA